MAIQGTQVPMYTKHTLFLYFLIFQFFFKIFYMKNKTKQNWKKNHTKTCWAKQSIKTRLTQNKSKTHKLCKNKNKKREKEKVIESFGAIFLPHPRRTFPLIKTLNRRWGEELKPLKFERNMRALRRSLRGARKDWSWFWLPDAIMLLSCSFHTLEEHFLWLNPWTGGEGEELKPFKFDRNMRVLRRSPRGAREDWSWFWLPDAIMLLPYWVANHL